MKRYFCLITLICLPFIGFAQTNVEEALKTLDNIVKNKQTITQGRLNAIEAVKNKFKYTKSPDKLYKLSDQLYELYRSFNIDSAEIYAKHKLALAQSMNNASYIGRSKLNLAEVYATEGIYKEALDLVGTVDKSTLDAATLKYYFHVYRSLYGFMADYVATKAFHKRYTDLKDIYRDSLMSVQDRASSTYSIVKADALLDKGNYKEALKLLLPWLKRSDNEMMRNLGYNLAIAYRQAGDEQKEEYYFCMSAIADLQSATKEYLSLLELSKLLYKKGDLERAYSYLKCTMEDAAYCNARLRTVETSEIYPIIDNAYQELLHKRSHQKMIAFACITLLAIVLAILLIYLNKQKNKLSLFRQNLIDLNEALKQSNSKLISTNVSLVEANHIKEASLSRYMELCSFYIDKMNEYQHSLIKIASNEKVEALYRALRSSEFIESELKDFYLNFDKTFLELFPTFVEEFNNMLVPEGRIYPKEKGQLNVELRIFALIRLGISDSAKIAKFLRYSVTTIYNYRVKVRNAAKGDRNTLEKEIMKIAQPND